MVEVTQADVHNAAIYWVGKKDRETFQSDIDYFTDNWRWADGMKHCVQAFARHREAAEAPLRAENAAKDAEIARLRKALAALIDACDRGRIVPKPGVGACGMTIEAQTRASCINGVDAWAVEEARAALAGDSND